MSNPPVLVRTRRLGRVDGASVPKSFPAQRAAGLSASGRHQAVVALVAAGLLLVVAFVWLMLVGSYAQYAAALIAGALVLLSLPIARHAARVEQWPALSALLMAAMVLRIGGSLARYVVASVAYGGVADASTYTQVARQHYKAFRHLHLFTPDTSVFHGLVPWLDTVVYALFGPTELGAFFLFAWFNFIGTYLFYRAFRIAYPGGDGRRYAALLFFIPSLLYWPSSLGKEGWMMLAIGLACYGLARALASRPGGYLALMAGVGAMLLVRPHLALIFLPAAFVAFLLRRSRPGRQRSPIGRIVGIAVLVVSGLVVIAKAQSYFGVNSLDVQTVTQQLQTTRQQTDLGNSAFSPPNAQSPLGFPEAIVTVLFRPFPFEAHSTTVLVSSLEGLVLIGLVVTSRRRLARIISAVRESTYVLFAVIYSLLFVFAFSNFSNFGILARERVQMFPLLLVLLAIPAAGSATEPAPAVDGPARSSGSRSEPSRRSSTPRGRPHRLRPYGAPPNRRPQARKPSSVAYTPVGAFRALGYRFDITVGGPSTRSLVPLIWWAFEDLRLPDRPGSPLPAEHRYRLTGIPGDEPLVRIERDGVAAGAPVLPARALVNLTNDVNQQAVASRPDRLTLHAGAVSLQGRGVLLPGPSGSGKSTMTAALVSIGCDYLSDEAVSVDFDSLEIEPYAKPLSLSRMSLEALGFGGRGSMELVPVSWLRESSVSRPVPARMLVFPRFEEGAATTLEPMSRAEALIELANNSFNFVNHGSEWLEGLRRVVAACSCWRVISGNVNEAAEILLGSAKDGDSNEHSRR